MGTTPRTYLQWLEENHKAGRDYIDTRPFDLERYFMENGRRISARTLVLEPGAEYRGRIIQDVIIETSSQGCKQTRYKNKCARCGAIAWTSEATLRQCGETHCAKCAERGENYLAGKGFKRKYPDPIPGERYGELTVVKTFYKGNWKDPRRRERCVEVNCSCGATGYVVLLANLMSGKTARCNRCAKRKSGDTQARAWRKYADICPDEAHRRRLLGRISACFQRCNNPNNTGYANYGGRGIRVEFKDAREFLAYLVTLDGWDNSMLEIDRIDNAGHYAKGNLRFVPRYENARNKRSWNALMERCRRLQDENNRLRDCLRHCVCGASQQISDTQG